MKVFAIMSLLMVVSCSAIQREEERAQEVEELVTEMHSSSYLKIKGQILLKDLKN